jgi:hypothetical protein
MANKAKPQKITFQSIVRLIVFIIIIYISISWLSRQKQVTLQLNDPTIYFGENIQKSNILNDIYNKLPQNSRYQLEHFSQTNIGIFFSNSEKYIVSQLNGFPQKQIKQIKKNIIKGISDDMIKNIDKN